MKVYTQKQELKAIIYPLKTKGYRVGFVPTMGALHEGHLHLVKKALANNDYVIVSIFVNPTQFDSAADLELYPRTLSQDIDLLKTVNLNNIMVYAPTVNDIYEGKTKADVFDFDGLEFEMEGKFRKDHFNGVGTIVKRLLEIVKPHHAYFGEKDYQQLQIIKKLVEKNNIPVTIVGCEIQREANGLAMSSRNSRLKPELKKAASFIYQTLTTAKIKFGTNSANKITGWVESQFANHDTLTLEYFTIADAQTLKPVKQKSNKKTYRAFLAVYAGDVRLIDNIALN